MAQDKYVTLFHSPIWRQKSFVSLWTSRLIMTIGSQIYLIALPWLVYNLTQSGSQMAFVVSFEMLPFIIFSLIGGVLSDKWNRRYCMIYGSLLSTIPLTAVFVLYQLDMLQIWHIYVSSFVLSSLTSIVMPAFEASIPSLVSKEDLVSANSLTELTNSVTTVLGPFLAAGVIAMFGADLAILLNGATYLISGIIFIIVRIEQQIANSARGLHDVFRSFWEGLVYVPRHRLLRWGVFMSTSNNIVLGAYSAILIFHMREDLHFDAGMTGTTLALSSIASILVASFVAPQLSRKFRKGITMIISLAIFGLGVVIVGLSTNVVTLIIGQALYTGAVTMFQINWYSLRQSVTPSDMLGRVSGTCRGIAYFGASIGGFLGGILLTNLDSTSLFVIDGAIVVFISFLAMFGALRSSDDLTAPTAANTSKSA